MLIGNLSRRHAVFVGNLSRRHAVFVGNLPKLRLPGMARLVYILADPIQRTGARRRKRPSAGIGKTRRVRLVEVG